MDLPGHLWGPYRHEGAGIQQLDPIIALGVALFIIKAAWDMTKRSGRDLLDEKLPPED